MITIDSPNRFVASNLGHGWYVLDKFLGHREPCADRKAAVQMADDLNQRTSRTA